MNFQVECRLKLHGGAVITPSPAQQKLINDFVTKLLVSGVKGTKKVWTSEEDAELKKAITSSDDNRMTSRLARQLAEQFGRSEKSIISRAWVLSQGKE